MELDFADFTLSSVGGASIPPWAENILLARMLPCRDTMACLQQPHMRAINQYSLWDFLNVKQTSIHILCHVGMSLRLILLKSPVFYQKFCWSYLGFSETWDLIHCIMSVFYIFNVLCNAQWCPPPLYIFGSTLFNLSRNISSHISRASVSMSFVFLLIFLCSVFNSSMSLSVFLPMNGAQFE